MARKIAPSVRKAQEVAQLLERQSAANSGEELLRALVRLSTERVLQEALAHEQTKGLGRDWYKRRGTGHGYRNGSTDGTEKTAEGV